MKNTSSPFFPNAQSRGQLLYDELVLPGLMAHSSRSYRANEPSDNCLLKPLHKKAHKASVSPLDSMHDNVRKAIEILGRGFLSANSQLIVKVNKKQLNGQDLFHQLLRLVYRIIFLFIIEERGLLHTPNTPSKIKENYRSYWSLSHIRNLPENNRDTKHFNLWEAIKFVMSSLGKAEGCPALGLSPLGGFLWSKAALPDLEDLKLSNAALLSALQALAWISFDTDKCPIDWGHLGALELGSIYESLLELQPLLEGCDFSLYYSLKDSGKGAKSGSERKITGSYYTPSPLIESLINSALEPLIQKARQCPDPKKALLKLKICDPACGSGYFLMAAARHLAKSLAQLQTGDSEPSPDVIRSSLREVVSHCIYGMDINPMALEICKLGFWLETHEAGKALSFLDHHLICANSLIGANSHAIRTGIPEAAYNAELYGNDKEAADALKKSARLWHDKLSRLQFGQFETELQKLINAVKHPLREVPSSDSIEEIEKKEKNWHEWLNSPAWQNLKFLFDLWTCAFILPANFPDATNPERPSGIGMWTLLEFANGRELDPLLKNAVHKAAADYQFFHLELMFPEVAEQGGFDVILANPPWKNALLKQQGWFAAHNRIDIALLEGNARKEAIRKLKDEDPALYELYCQDKRQIGATRHFYKNSGLYPLCSRGRVNLYTIFAEWMRKNLKAEGLMGCILPSGLVTDYTPRFFFQDLISKKSLKSYYDFENHSDSGQDRGTEKRQKKSKVKSEKFFPAVDSRFRFSLLTCGSGAEPLSAKADLMFLAHKIKDLDNTERRITLSKEDICLFNPNTQTCPIFISKKDFVLARAIYGRFPILNSDRGDLSANAWKIKFSQGMLNMTSKSKLFRTKKQLEEEGWVLAGNIFQKGDKKYLPIYEGKMIHHYNHRWASATACKSKAKFVNSTAAELLDPDYSPMPRYWIDEQSFADELRGLEDKKTTHASLPGVFPPDEKEARIDKEFADEDMDNEEMEDLETDATDCPAFLDEEKSDSITNIRENYKWLIGFRGITNSTNERTLVGGAFPLLPVGNSLLLFFSDSKYAPFLPAFLSSLVCDFLLRCKLGGTNFNRFHARQLPIPAPEMLDSPAPWQPEQSLAEWLKPRILELTFTTDSMRPFALAMGYDGAPFPFDEERRSEILAEVEAAFFHLYLPSDANGYWSEKHWQKERDFTALQENFPSARDAAAFILDSFPLLKKKEFEKYACYKSKNMILKAYDIFTVRLKS